MLPVICVVSLLGQALPSIKGHVTYPQRSALPDNAVVQVRLLDVTSADSPAEVTSVSIPAAGKQVPVPFQLPYAANLINAAHRYELSASILIEGAVAFLSARHYPVMPGSTAGEVSIVVQPVSASESGASPFENATWELIEINGKPSKGAHVTLEAQGTRLSGNSGCNRMIGGYVLNGESLRFAPVGSTMMACPEPAMNLERDFLKALSETKRFRVRNGELEFSDGFQIVAKFKKAF